MNDIRIENSLECLDDREHLKLTGPQRRRRRLFLLLPATHAQTDRPMQVHHTRYDCLTDIHTYVTDIHTYVSDSWSVSDRPYHYGIEEVLLDSEGSDRYFTQSQNYERHWRAIEKKVTSQFSTQLVQTFREGCSLGK